VSILVSIGDFSRMTLLSVKALRHYHDVGLLPPAEIDPDTGYRRYEVGQVPMAQVIRRLRELGMSLECVRAVIEAPDVGARNAAISAHLSRMEGELEQTRATVRSLRLLLDEKPPPKIAVDYRVSGPAEALAIRDEIAHDDMFDWLDAALTDLRSALERTGARRTGADAALFSSELMEDELGEIVAVVPVEAAEPSRPRRTARPSARRVRGGGPRWLARGHRPHLRGARRRGRRACDRRAGANPRDVPGRRVRDAGRSGAPHRGRLAHLPDDLTLPSEEAAS
jgi:DNA-binding transcriptional MerR regulator